MNNGVLLDTHVLLWMYARLPIREACAREIARCTAAGRCHVSAISAWEIGSAARKKRVQARPDLGTATPADLFHDSLQSLQLNLLPIDEAIATESANVPDVFGYSDPGDCFLIATARVHGLALLTRDSRILALSARAPEYLSTLAC